ncbi:hypothetical protein [Zunongwangia sp. HGR-M22]|uniref:hypothetical protein n=1 Tax=Zunongwangia sp. HGR-M22 TaxID=3015168 RepID=UPI0022DDF735|nr:hypothetical protein [Zunongwangia sp. HGR-M22]WBL27011.1 hypothetical protein PBT91_07005 [Zunongwangia sp. HGR-M22]
MKKELADLICNMHSCWSTLLVEKELGNYAPSIWQVKLAAEEVKFDEMNKTFQFKNAKFSFDVNLEEPPISGMNYVTSIPVSGKGTYELDENNSALRISELVVEEC